MRRVVKKRPSPLKTKRRPAKEGAGTGQQKKGGATKTFPLLAAHGGVIVSRSPMEVALPAIALDAGFGFSMAQAGGLLAAASVSYAVGKLTHSSLIDRCSPRAYLLGILAVAAGACAVGASAPGYAALVASTLMLNFMRAGAWQASTKIAAQHYDAEELPKVLGLLAMVSRATAVGCAIALGSLLVCGCSWRALYGATGVVVVAVGALSWRFLRLDDHEKDSSEAISQPRPRRAQRSHFVAAGGDHDRSHPTRLLPHAFPEEQTGVTLSQALKVFVQSPQVWMCVAAKTSCSILMEWQAFVPLYLRETLSLLPGHAAQVSSSFALGCAAAVLAGSVVYSRLEDGQRTALVAGMLTVFSAAMCTLLAVQTGAIGPLGVGPTVGLLLTLGCTLALPFYVPATMFAARFGGPFQSTLEGGTEAIAYGITSLFVFSAFAAKASGGWAACLAAFTVTAVVATLCSTVSLAKEWRSPEPGLAA